jgi:MYXO-CTERM domain-containing protein
MDTGGTGDTGKDGSLGICGCSPTGGAAASWLSVLLALGVVARRRDS